MSLPSRAPSAPKRPEISIVIPAFNEAVRIRRTVEEVIAWADARFLRYEVLVVDDGSTDATSEEVRGVASAAVRCLRNPSNSGKGFSVRRGMGEAACDPILFTDADLSTPIGETERLLEKLDEGFDAAIASRRMPGSRVRRSIPRRLLGWGFSWMVSALALPGFRDTQCGFKAFRRAAAQEIFPWQTIDRWGFDVEILLIARRRGFRVAEVPVRWKQSGDSRIRLGTPLQMAVELLRIRRNEKKGLYGPIVERPGGILARSPGA